MSAWSTAFTAPASPQIARTFQRFTGLLTLMATIAAVEDHRGRLAVWAIGRPTHLALLPYGLAALLALSATAMALRIAPIAAGFCAFGVMVALNNLLPFAYHNNHYLLSLFVLLVTVGNLWPDTVWTSRALQLQLSTVYLVSIFVKMAHPWWGGTGRVIAWAVDHHPAASTGWFGVVIGAALRQPYVPQWTDVVITAIEATLPFALFSSRWRRVGLSVAIAMHCTMQEWLFPQMFTFLMLTGFHAFGPSSQGAFTVRYRAEDPTERRLQRLYARLDWFGRTTWEAGPSLSLSGANEAPLSRGDTLRMLVLLTPATLLGYVAFALFLPLHRAENTLIATAGLALLPLAFSSLRRAVSLPP